MNLCACIYIFGKGRENTTFYRMIDSYCEGKRAVVALDCVGDWNLYSFLQLVKRRCMVDTRFYMPRNFRLQHADSPQQLEQMARELAASGRQVVILSGDAGMPNTPDLLCANSNGIPIRGGSAAGSTSTTGPAFRCGTRTPTRCALQLQQPHLDGEPSGIAGQGSLKPR